MAKCKVQNMYPARDKWPLAKRKGIFFQQVSFFAGSNNQSANSSTTKHYSSTVQPTDNTLFVYSASGKIFNDKTLFRYSTMDKFFNKLRLLSAKAEAIIKSKQPAVPTAGISLYKISKFNDSRKAYIRDTKSKKRAERIGQFPLYFALAFMLSFSLKSKCTLFTAIFSISKFSTKSSV